jgi:carbonic anhydrase
LVNQTKKERREKANVEQHCITLREDYDSSIRICHEKKDLMDKVNLKINFCILKNNIKSPKVKPEAIISKMNLKKTDEIEDYDWENQDKWKGRCNKEYMRSPINIITSQAEKLDKSFAFDYRMDDSEVVVKKGKADVVTTFLKFPGMFNLAAQGNKLSYMPVSVNYRFPGETIIDGKRSEGDIVIDMEPIANKPSEHITNGFSLTIPLRQKKSAKAISTIDKLDPEIWPEELKNKGQYIPKTLKKKPYKFKIEEIIKRLMKEISSKKTHGQDFFMYQGSETVPGCKSDHIWIIPNASIPIPPCQFNILRRNSLLSSLNKPFAIHSRVEQKLGHRNVYSFSQKNMGVIKSFEGLVPQSFNKYLSDVGPKYRFKIVYKYGKPIVQKVAARKVKKWVPPKKKTLDCEIDK